MRTEEEIKNKINEIHSMQAMLPIAGNIEQGDIWIDVLEWVLGDNK